MHSHITVDVCASGCNRRKAIAIGVHVIIVVRANHQITATTTTKSIVTLVGQSAIPSNCISINIWITVKHWDACVLVIYDGHRSATIYIYLMWMSIFLSLLVRHDNGIRALAQLFLVALRSLGWKRIYDIFYAISNTLLSTRTHTYLAKYHSMTFTHQRSDLWLRTPGTSY